MVVLKTNIEKETLRNKFYRKVIFTGEKIQLVLMSLKGGEEIHMEVHHNTDQFIRIESGSAKAYIGGKNFNLKKEDIIIIPAETRHRIVNASKTKPLKLYSIYADPEHKPGTIHKTKADADHAESKHNH